MDEMTADELMALEMWLDAKARQAWNAREATRDIFARANWRAIAEFLDAERRDVQAQLAALDAGAKP